MMEQNLLLMFQQFQVLRKATDMLKVTIKFNGPEDESEDGSFPNGGTLL